MTRIRELSSAWCQRRPRQVIPSASSKRAIFRRLFCHAKSFLPVSHRVQKNNPPQPRWKPPDADRRVPGWRRSSSCPARGTKLGSHVCNAPPLVVLAIWISCWSRLMARGRRRGFMVLSVFVVVVESCFAASRSGPARSRNGFVSAFGTGQLIGIGTAAVRSRVITQATQPSPFVGISPNH